MWDEELPVIYPDAFEDENIEEKIQLMLEEMGITIVKETQLMEIITDKDKDKDSKAGGQGSGHDDAAASLERVVFKRLDIPDEEEEEEEIDYEDKENSEHESNFGGMTGGEDDNLELEEKS